MTKNLWNYSNAAKEQLHLVHISEVIPTSCRNNFTYIFQVKLFRRGAGISSLTLHKWSYYRPMHFHFSTLFRSCVVKLFRVGVITGHPLNHVIKRNFACFNFMIYVRHNFILSLQWHNKFDSWKKNILHPTALLCDDIMSSSYYHIKIVFK